MTKVLFVCKANICRSPLAEIYFRHQVKVKNMCHKFLVDSAGVECPGEGIEMDPMVKQIREQYELQSPAVLSRSVQPNDLNEFDHILAMDLQTILSLEELGPKAITTNLDLLLNYGPSTTPPDVPDPVARDFKYFEEVYGLIKIGVQGFLKKISP